MATLSPDFERKARTAILDDAEAKLFGELNNIVFNALQAANEHLRTYGQRYGYTVESVVESGQVTEARRTDTGIEVTVEWDHEAAGYFQTGTDAHMVSGNPTLSFIWEDAPQDIHDMFPHTEREGGDPRVFFPEVHVEGLPPAKYLQALVKSVRAQLQPRGSGGRFA